VYPDMTYEVGQTKKFELTIQKGDFTDSEIIVLLGENGTGKTTFIRYTFYVFLIFLRKWV